VGEEVATHTDNLGALAGKDEGDVSQVLDLFLLNGQDLAPIVGSTIGAYLVRRPQFFALRTGYEPHKMQGILRAAAITTPLG